MTLKIYGHLTAFGSLVIALLVLAFSFEQLGSVDLAEIAKTYAGIVFAIIIFGACIAILSRFMKLPKII